jgi:hypothetical protein
MKIRSMQPDVQTRPSQMPFFNRQTNAQAVVQTKLTVGSANDAYEHEADRTADMVMRKPENTSKNGAYTEGSPFMPTITPVVQRACTHCENDKEQTAQRKEAGAATGGFTAPDSVSRAISRGGSALDGNAKTFMESRFNRSFDNVQVHTDGESAASARDISARAYTSGNHIVFGDGQYQPNTDGGRHLLAHELTHVVQQGEEIRRKTPTPSFEEMHHYRHPGNVKLKLTVFKSKNIKTNFISSYVAKATSMLAEHGLGLNIYNAPDLDFGKPISQIVAEKDEDNQHKKDARAIRGLAHQAYNSPEGRLPVIFVPFDVGPARGITISDTEWMPFVLINSESQSADNVTMLHEMGHAAKIRAQLVDIKEKKPNALRNIMTYDDDRNNINKMQVLDFAKCYFAGA